MTTRNNKHLEAFKNTVVSVVSYGERCKRCCKFSIHYDNKCGKLNLNNNCNDRTVSDRSRL